MEKTSKKGVIRPMQPDDWPRVSEIYTQGIKSGHATFTRECPTYAQWDAAHHKEGRLVILSTDGSVAGWCSLSPAIHRPPYHGVAESSIYIADTKQGRGYATALLNALVAESERCGFWTICAIVLGSNPASMALHEKCGFRRVGVCERAAQDRFGVWQDAVLYERRSPLP